MYTCFLWPHSSQVTQWSLGPGTQKSSHSQLYVTLGTFFVSQTSAAHLAATRLAAAVIAGSQQSPALVAALPQATNTSEQQRIRIIAVIPSDLSRSKNV